MTNEHALPEPPDISGLNPQLMTASELQSRLEELFGWLGQVEAEPGERSQADENLIDRVRDAANMLLLERRERHSDETAPRGG